MNRVSLIGRLTKDPVVFDSSNGKVAKFNLATKVGYDPEKKEDRTEFVPVTAFGLRDSFLQYLKKGRKISVDGRISTDSFEKDGKTEWSTAVKVHNGGLQLEDSLKKEEPEAASAEA
jgi:single-strand DNA-binding protein